ncbi:MAG: hypothetical protein KKC37_17070, partial [Proteobacteria bacterium]|nr:hypothetical protein [Pseudomonadota bacterium]
FEQYSFAHASGGTLGETGTRNPTVSAGVFYCGHNRVTTDAIDCSGAGTFSVWNSSASTTPDATAQTQYDNTQYWTGAALDTMTVNRYGTRFFYLDKGGALHMQYGTSNVTSVGAADAEAVPTPPAYLTSFAVYIGRMVIRNSAATASVITSAFTMAETGQLVTDHGNLSGLSDDDHPQYLLNTGDTTTGQLQCESALAASFGKDAATNTAGKTRYWSAGATDFYADVVANTMSANATFTLPAAVAGAESFLKMGTDGVIDYDTSTYLTAEADTMATASARGETVTADLILPAGGKLRYVSGAYVSTLGETALSASHARTWPNAAGTIPVLTAIPSVDNAIIRSDNTQGGIQKALATIDDSGNLSVDGSYIKVLSSFCGNESANAFRFYTNYGTLGISFGHEGLGLEKGVVRMGSGNLGESTLGAALTQDDVIIKRDVNGASAYAESGALLHLWRDVTLTTSTTGNFVEWSNDGATPLGYIDTAGDILLATGRTVKINGVDVLADLGKRTFVFALCGSGTALAVADGTLGLVVPAIYAGWNLVDVEVACHTKGVTNTTDIQLRRRRAGADADMLTVKLTLGDEYYVSDETIDTGNDDLAAGDLIYIDVDAVHDTPPQGVTVIMTVRTP